MGMYLSKTEAGRKIERKIGLILDIIVLIGLAIYSLSTLPMSEKSARKLLNEKFDVCMDLMYPSEPYFKWSEEMTLIKEDYCYEIINYESVCNKYFTPNAKEYFDKHVKCVIFNEGYAYITEGGTGFSGFGGVEFENLYISLDAIIADAIQTRVDGDGDLKEKMKSTFSLVKVEDEWKIDEFATVDDLENWVEYE